MASTAVEEALRYVEMGLRIIGLKTYIEVNISHEGIHPWKLRRSGDKGLQFHCPNSTIRQEVATSIKGPDRVIESIDQSNTVLITLAAS